MAATVMGSPAARVRRGVGLGVVAVVLLVWTLLPVYHMVMMSLSPDGEVFERQLWPENPTLSNFWTVLTAGDFFIENFWRQLWNSIFVAALTTLLVLTIGSSASFAIARLRPRWGNALSNAALATYVIPTSFLAIPLYRAMANYSLLDTSWALIFSMTAFASPYAMWVFTQYAKSGIPLELDESARVDGATNWQIYVRIYLPLMRPVLVAIGTYALLSSWNEYLLAFLLLNSAENMTLPVALGSFLNTDQVPWNLLMATSLIYAIPPVIIYYVFRKNVSSGMTAGGVKT
ncbi:carbohydrate ABC transporter permease [Pseudonocardia sichuanensis]|uniref:Carbohydrate ABC transporter membrane protein 2 (CUT1 family) n=1 Tax=Pseudonocardia kunmingensis TaxID=630975 RepID=A0A543DQS0_9PSEU|nr:carbohydrate ABC transporter permease [Pseudonocardia kunmingensis]TQM11649.1 carbohydrate ABC transporter membrane protein 2 (CUT1 family) [Pseudonocardia kunmingensis]